MLPEIATKNAGTLAMRPSTTNWSKAAQVSARASTAATTTMSYSSSTYHLLRRMVWSLGAASAALRAGFPFSETYIHQASPEPKKKAAMPGTRSTRAVFSAPSGMMMAFLTGSNTGSSQWSIEWSRAMGIGPALKMKPATIEQVASTISGTVIGQRDSRGG
jgi:hypothetical protein